VSRLKIKSVAVCKEARYLNVLKADGVKGFKRVYWRVIALTSKGQFMFKHLYPKPEKAINKSLVVLDKGWLHTEHWEK
jgi:hypothetical protein